MSKVRQAAISVARIISAAFVAILLTGPPPFGYLVLLSTTWGFLDDLLAMLMMGVLQGLFAGFFAGRRLAVWAAIIASAWAFSGPLAEMVKSLLGPRDEYWVYALIGTPVFLACSSLYAALFGMIGGRLSEQLSFEQVGRHAWVWVAIAAAAILTAGYAQTSGRECALRSIAPLAESSAVSKPVMEAEIRCIFPTIRVWPLGGRRDPSELYYLDPTGRRVLHRAEEKAD